MNATPNKGDQDAQEKRSKENEGPPRVFLPLEGRSPQSGDFGVGSLAVALKYAPGDRAPKVVAKGRGLIAAEIIARAREHGVYVHESPELVTLLQQVDLDEHIPPALYVAVAELLAWLYQVEQKNIAPILSANKGAAAE